MPTVDLAEFDLADLPTAESDEYEFKGSATPANALKEKLAQAVSGFANSGGGCFVAGVDGQGNPDGGFSKAVGRQNRRDWVDQVVHQVEPPPSYDVRLIDDPNGRGVINPDCCVLVVVVEESYSGPHMAPDRIYYIRAGAHTVPARHFLVDAIWAKRHFAKPRLTHVLRLNPDEHQWVQLGIVAVTAAPALDVIVNLSPLGEILKGNEEWFPLRIPLIDRDNPFFFDITTSHNAEERLGKDVCLRVTYKDLAGNSYTYEPPISVRSSIPPLLVSDFKDKIVKTLESIEKILRKGVG